MSENTTLAQRQESVIKFLNDPKRLSAIAKVAPRYLTPERLLRIGTNAISRTPLLLECDPMTLYASIVRAAELGLEVGGALGQAYLVPFKNKSGKRECQLIVGYQGYIDLVYRSGQVKDIYAQVVYRDDHFKFMGGLNPVLEHAPADTERKVSEITHAYMIAHLTTGGVVYDVMSRWELDRVRTRSRAQDDGPWKTDAAEMYRKTVVRRGVKYLPKSVELSKLVALDHAVDTGDFRGLEFDTQEVIDAEYSENGNGHASKGTQALKGKIAEPAPQEPETGEDHYDGPTVQDDEEGLGL